ncbi:MAG: P1 family peptidase [Bacteroidales bacterium]|nr:P1 family peptidase [Bacteroidales bacterium]
MKRTLIAAAAVLAFMSISHDMDAQQKRMRDWCGFGPGVMKTGQYNAITDVPGVKVGQVTLRRTDDMRTGVTAIIPHDGNLFQLKTPAAAYVGNGFGKLAGTTQIMELGNIETPVILTNTLNVAEGISGVVDWTLAQPGNENVRSVNAVVGETNDGGLNNIRARYVTREDVIQAIESAKGGPVEEGCVGAGSGTVAFGVKGGIGTSSRVLPQSMGGYTVGVIVQSNYGGVLEIDGVPIGQMTQNYSYRSRIIADVDGSCMIVVATDAPVDARNLERMAKRAIMGLAKTGGIASNGSGDYVIAMSVCPENLIDDSKKFYTPTLLHNDDMSALFMATIEATEEALWDSLFCAEDTVGMNGKTVKALDKQLAADALKKARKTSGLDRKK